MGTNYNGQDVRDIISHKIQRTFTSIGYGATEINKQMIIDSIVNHLKDDILESNNRNNERFLNFVNRHKETLKTIMPEYNEFWNNFNPDAFRNNNDMFLHFFNFFSTRIASEPILIDYICDYLTKTSGNRGVFENAETMGVLVATIYGRSIRVYNTSNNTYIDFGDSSLPKIVLYHTIYNPENPELDYRNPNHYNLLIPTNSNLEVLNNNVINGNSSNPTANFSPIDKEILENPAYNSGLKPITNNHESTSSPSLSKESKKIMKEKKTNDRSHSHNHKKDYEKSSNKSDDKLKSEADFIYHMAMEDNTLESSKNLYNNDGFKLLDDRKQSIVLRSIAFLNKEDDKERLLFYEKCINSKGFDLLDKKDQAYALYSKFFCENTLCRESLNKNIEAVLESGLRFYKSKIFKNLKDKDQALLLHSISILLESSKNFKESFKMGMECYNHVGFKEFDETKQIKVLFNIAFCFGFNKGNDPKVKLEWYKKCHDHVGFRKLTELQQATTYYQMSTLEYLIVENSDECLRLLKKCLNCKGFRGMKKGNQSYLYYMFATLSYKKSSLSNQEKLKLLEDFLFDDSFTTLSIYNQNEVKEKIEILKNKIKK